VVFYKKKYIKSLTKKKVKNKKGGKRMTDGLHLGGSTRKKEMKNSKP